MTLHNAIKSARRLAKKTGDTYYVIFVPWDYDYRYGQGPYQYASDYDLDTFYQGTPDNDIVWCSDD